VHLQEWPTFSSISSSVDQSSFPQRALAPSSVPEVNRAGIFKNSMGARNRVTVPARQATWASEIHSLESTPGPHKHLKIRAQI